MEELLYDVTTLARIIIERDMSVTKQQKFLNTAFPDLSA